MKRQIQSLLKNYKLLSIIASIIVTISSISYGVASYTISTHENIEDLLSLRKEFTEYRKEASIIHKDFENRLNESEREFKMTTTKLDVSLAKIATDLQFIKEQLMSRGMNK